MSAFVCGNISDNQWRWQAAYDKTIYSFVCMILTVLPWLPFNRATADPIRFQLIIFVKENFNFTHHSTNEVTKRAQLQTESDMPADSDLAEFYEACAVYRTFRVSRSTVLMTLWILKKLIMLVKHRTEIGNSDGVARPKEMTIPDMKQAFFKE